MDEREKMARGLLYDANHNPDLIKERAACKDMCFAYNSLRPSDEEGKRKIAERLFGRIGRAFRFLRRFTAITVIIYFAATIFCQS